MKVTSHIGFHHAINASELTAFEAFILTAVIEAIEVLFSDFSQCQKDGDQGLVPSHQGQEAYPIHLDPLSEKYIAAELRKRLAELFSNSSSNDPRQFMTVAEIMAYDLKNVESHSPVSKASPAHGTDEESRDAKPLGVTAPHHEQDGGR